MRSRFTLIGCVLQHLKDYGAYSHIRSFFVFLGICSLRAYSRVISPIAAPSARELCIRYVGCGYCGLPLLICSSAFALQFC